VSSRERNKPQAEDKLFDQNQDQVSAEGCSHRRTGRSVERLYIQNNGARLSGPCFLLFRSRQFPLRVNASAWAGKPASRSLGWEASCEGPRITPPPWQGKQRDKRCASPRTGADTDVFAKTNQSLPRRVRFPGTAFPFISNCHPGPCGLKVHHEIRDPKALCASKNEASKAHSLGALLNSDSATRRSAERSPKDTRRATSAVSTGSPGQAGG
jgi:hypothetical protein